MCIALLTTSHPDYALIVIDNRDEFILRPTSRPHWWTPSSPPASVNGDAAHPNGTANGTTNGTSKQPIEILCSRDLQRAEKGTWLGITRGGNFAVLTNYREGGPDHPSVAGTRSRGAIVNAWLTADPRESVTTFAGRMLEGGETKGVGGFSLICGKLRRKRGTAGAENGDTVAKGLDPMAIISNRHETVDAVPWICDRRGEIYGLSNMVYVSPEEAAAGEPTWPKVANGIDLLKKAIDSAVQSSASEDALVQSLYQILDDDRLPVDPGMKFDDYIGVLKESIFIPPVGDEKHQKEMDDAVQNGYSGRLGAAAAALKGAERPDPGAQGFMTGLYGTQRQTIILVDWDGNVTYKERALWDENGKPIERGEGDVTFSYQIEGWESE